MGNVNHSYEVNCICDDGTGMAKDMRKKMNTMYAIARDYWERQKRENKSRQPC